MYFYALLRWDTDMVMDRFSGMGRFKSGLRGKGREGKGRKGSTVLL